MSGFEVLVVSTVGVVSAILGGWFGFWVSRRADKRSRGFQLALSLYSAEMSHARLKARYLLEEFSIDTENYAELANFKCTAKRPQRVEILHLFNFYDLACDTYLAGDLDNRTFTTYISPLILEDCRLAEPFFAAMESFNVVNGDGDRRPFFPNLTPALKRVEKYRN
ncbi:hypothetical protein [Pseudooceanicola marinus]|uniref:hypothetical protein n=1 Tax=Pseudooceanicola marinus TaxID=396013 RepID=UPI001CD57025|nr:hypothetical protein [Pseudooceanicola marinus]MCA1334383.1 hypothetical protein [Pseudooceanicola marinus]